MKTPTVSVIIPTYNRAHLVARAIRSALAAIEPGDEIIVVDDGSSDATEMVVTAFGNPVKFVRAKHGGAGAARNVGIQHSSGNLVAFLDSDDEWFPEKLSLQRCFMANRPDVLFCCTNFQVRMDSGEISHNFLQHWHHDKRSWNEILTPGVPYSTICNLPANWPDFQVHIGDLYFAEMASNYVATSTVMVRRQEAGDALRFADDLRISEDKECFAKLARSGAAAYFDCETSIQWGHSGPRVTDANSYDFSSARIVLLNRIWARDPNFMAQHGARVQHEMNKEYLTRVRWLLVRGRNHEARADLRQVRQAPISFRVLASLPSPITRTVLAFRRWLNHR